MPVQSNKDGWVDRGGAWISRGAVTRALKGKRGQFALRDLIVQLDNMPEKRLISGSFYRLCDGGVSALGALAVGRHGMSVSDLNPPAGEDVDIDEVANQLNIAPEMVWEIMRVNDDSYVVDELPEQRWTRIRKFAVKWLKDTESV